MSNAPAGWYPDPLSGKLKYFDGEKWLDIPPPQSNETKNQNSSDIYTHVSQNFEASSDSDKSKMKRKSKRLCLCANPTYKDGKCVYCGDFVGESGAELNEKTKFEKSTPFVRDGTCVCANPQFSESDICQKCRRVIRLEDREKKFELDKSDNQKYGLIGNYVVCSECGELNKNSTWCLKCHKKFETSENRVSPTVDTSDTPHKGRNTRKRNWVLVTLTFTLVAVFIGTNVKNNSADWTSSVTNSPSNAGEILTRLNNSSDIRWSEDPANDWTGSRSLAVYLEMGGDNCAVWVFGSEAVARSALDSVTLDFPGLEIYVGQDSFSNLGVIALSPYSGARCEFDIAEALGWDK